MRLAACATTLALTFALVLGGCATAADGEDGMGAPLAQSQRTRVMALPSLGAREVSVSGLSSGGYFAEQVAVAFSSTIVGAGIIAAGPYDCAGEHPFWECMYLARPEVGPAIARTRAWSGTRIDDVAHRSAQRIFLLSGALDTTVATTVMDRLRDYEAAFVAPENLAYASGLPFAHTFPTDVDGDGDNPCWLAAPPYISNCGYDAAGAILRHIYGSLAPRSSGPPAGALVRFDQREFIAPGLGLAPTGWLYVPPSCAVGARCRLHVVFHGCTQNEATVGDRFVSGTGYLGWADSNDVLVLFPQTAADLVDHFPWPSDAGANVDACWDWVGYYGADFDRRTGVQLAAVKRMIDRLTAR